MTVTELREFLQEQEKLGKGNCLICVVKSDCEPICDFESKFTTDIVPFYDPMDNTITIGD